MSWRLLFIVHIGGQYAINRNAPYILLLTRSQWLQAKQGFPHVSLPSKTFQLLAGYLTSCQNVDSVFFFFGPIPPFNRVAFVESFFLL